MNAHPLILLSYLLRRDMRIFLRGAHSGLTLAFFFIAIIFIPFGLAPDLVLLQNLAPGLIWVSLSLATLLSLEHIIQPDLEDGSFDQLLLADISLELICAVKALAHWLAIVAPLIVLAPVAGILLNIRPDNLFGLMLILLAGSPALSFLGLIGASLSASITRSGFLSALLVMPFYVPVLIFGAGALTKYFNGAPIWVEFILLLLFSLASALLIPIAAARILRKE